MYVIDKVAIHSDIPSIQFACDLSECKGACCSLKGAGGAPIDQREISVIRKAIPAVKKYLSQSHQQHLNNNDFFYKYNAEYALQSVNDRDCVFAFRENGIVKCSFEYAFARQEINFQKPISCHLFPLRIRNFGGPILHYERLDECRSAVKKGTDEQILLYDFLHSSLKRKFGNSWFNKMRSIFRVSPSDIE
ncbi:MAG: DUF3109 family protein [Ignavibacteria bacterium]|nr:DUF3109 family protein [Ignavibacteria bacterium]